MTSESAVVCQDCGKPYSGFSFDLVLPDQQWKVICPEDGILCANCICRRAEKHGGTAILGWINNLNYQD